MGYYLNCLQQGKMYELDGQKLQFIEKVGGSFYFYVCKVDDWTFNYTPTEETVSLSVKEMTYIKRFDQEPTQVRLRKIGKDKVFPRS